MHVEELRKKELEFADYAKRCAQSGALFSFDNRASARAGCCLSLLHATGWTTASNLMDIRRWFAPGRGGAELEGYESSFIRGAGIME